MLKILQATTENLASNAKTATLTSISSGVAVWGIELPIFLQMVGVVIAFVSMIIGGLYYWALIKERKRSNRVKEEQRKRQLDIEERKLKGK